ncbi:MAG: DUF2155 domain-containing protein [Alphaproteobacteria bacterium]|nr:DUF2155 domain-containing protein [Alphaproteobacteria bacterium]
MKRALALLLLLPALAAAQAWLPRQNVRLQALDKVTARVTVVDARVGEAVRYGTLTITVRACNARPADEVPDAAAWLEIFDSRMTPAQGAAFRGWMFANAPAVSMLEHPVYDVRVLECR